MIRDHHTSRYHSPALSDYCQPRTAASFQPLGTKTPQQAEKMTVHFRKLTIEPVSQQLSWSCRSAPHHESGISNNFFAMRPMSLAEWYRESVNQLDPGAWGTRLRHSCAVGRLTSSCAAMATLSCPQGLRT